MPPRSVSNRGIADPYDTRGPSSGNGDREGLSREESGSSRPWRVARSSVMVSPDPRDMRTPREVPQALTRAGASRRSTELNSPRGELEAEKRRPAARRRRDGRGGASGNTPAATYSPTRKPCSTIGSGGLNCRVRHGRAGRPATDRPRETEKRRPAARCESRSGASGKNSGSDLLSHTETVQYHRLWRA